MSATVHALPTAATVAKRDLERSYANLKKYQDEWLKARAEVAHWQNAIRNAERNVLIHRQRLDAHAQ